MSEEIKKSDMQNFIDLYKSIDIEIKPVQNKERNFDITIGEDCYEDEENKCIHDGKFDGYSGFCSVIVFDSNGKFIKQGFWE